MSYHDDFDRSLARWIDAEARPAATADVLDRALSATRRRRPRPALFAALGSHWVGDGVGPASGGGTLWRTGLGTSMALLLLLLVLVLVAGAVVVGARLTQPAPVDFGIFEPVAGRIVYHADSSLWGVDPNATSPATTLVRLGAAGQFASRTVPLGWSSDGTKLLFLREDPNPPDREPPIESLLYVLHSDGTETQVTPGPVRNAAISPDGSRVAFSTSDVPERKSLLPEGLYVVDAQGGEPVRIAREGTSPTFSPDGTQIAYISSPAGGIADVTGSAPVWLVNVDGTDAHQILADEPGVANIDLKQIKWSPTGDRIAVYRRFGGQEENGAIYTFAPDGSDFTMVINGGFAFHWSPDGSRIAYRCLSVDSCTLAIADTDGSNVRTLGVGDSGPWHPARRGPSPRPSRATEFLRFSSTIHGISIDYPSSWQIRPATDPWAHDAFTFDAPGVDVIFDPTLQDDLYISLTSEPLGGQSAEDWWTSALAWAADEVCETGGTFGGLSWDGWGGAARGCDADEDQVIAVATATHGYLIYLHVGDDPVLRARYDWNNFFGPLTLETVELR